MGNLNEMIIERDVEYKDTVSLEARELMAGMLEKRPTQRLTAQDVLDHPWLADAED